MYNFNFKKHPFFEPHLISISKKRPFFEQGHFFEINQVLFLNMDVFLKLNIFQKHRTVSLEPPSPNAFLFFSFSKIFLRKENNPFF